MGRIGTLPRGFARLSPYRTPSVAIIVHNVAALVIAIGLGLLFGVTTAFGLIGTILTLGLLILYFASQVYPLPPYPLNLSLPVLAVWIVLGILYPLYLNRTNPKGLERGKDVFLEDLEPEPKNLLSALE